MFPWQFYTFYDAYDVGLRDDLLKAKSHAGGELRQPSHWYSRSLVCIARALQTSSCRLSYSVGRVRPTVKRLTQALT